MSLRSDFIDVIQRDRLANATELNNESLVSFLNKAVQVYSRLRPRELVVDFNGDGSAYEWNLPSDWVDGFSQIVSVEYPAGSQNPSYVKAYRYLIYRSSSTIQKFRFINIIPSSTEVVRVVFSAPHVVSESSDTSYLEDFEAICDLAGAVGASYLAAKFAQTQSTTLDADAINYLSKVDYYNNLSIRLTNSFSAHFGMREGDISPAISKIGDFDILFPWGEDLLTHPRKYR